MSKFFDGLSHSLGRATGWAIAVIVIAVGVYVGGGWYLSWQKQRMISAVSAPIEKAKDAIDDATAKAREASKSAVEKARPAVEQGATVIREGAGVVVDVVRDRGSKMIERGRDLLQKKDSAPASPPKD